jgi:hypothetical protein
VLPSDAYERLDLDDSAGMAELRTRWLSASGILSRRSNYEAIVARVEFDENLPRAIELVPVDLRFGEGGILSGCPRIADRRSGERIIATASGLARRLGTSISYDSATNRGWVAIGGAAAGSRAGAKRVSFD